MASCAAPGLDAVVGLPGLVLAFGVFGPAVGWLVLLQPEEKIIKAAEMKTKKLFRIVPRKESENVKKGKSRK